MRSISQAEHFPGVMLSARTQNTSLVTKTTAINVNYLKMLRTTQGPRRCRQASLILEAFFSFSPLHCSNQKVRKRFQQLAISVSVRLYCKQCNGFHHSHRQINFIVVFE
jgi:hypothetical protein